MADINNYSLELALNLATNADQVLGRVSNLVSSIQDQVAAVAKNLSGAIDVMSGGLNAQMQQMANAAAEAAVNVKDIAPGMQAVADVADQAAAMQGQMADNTAAVLQNMQQTADVANQTADVHAQMADDTAKILQDQIELNKTVKDGVESYLDINEAVAQSKEDQTDANDGWDDHLLSLGDVLDMSNALSGSFAQGGAQVVNMAAAVGDLISNFLSLLGVLYLLDAAWKELAQDEERFVTLNYRLYGSQREIISQVNELTKEHGVFRDVAMEAYQAMAGSTRVPQEELDDFVETVVKFNRTTGVAVGVTTDFSRQLRLSGYDLAAIEERVRMFEFAMEQAGATTEEVGRLIQHQMQQNAMRVGLWGKEAATALNEQETLMWSLVKATGANADAYLELNNAAMTNAMNMGILKSKAWDYAAAVNRMAGSIKINIDTMSEHERISLGMLATLQEAQDVMNSGLEGDEQIQILETMSNQSFGGNYVKQIQEMVLALDQLEATGADTTTMMSIIESKMPNWEDDLARMDAYNESIQSITATVTVLTDKMRAMWSEMVIALAPVWLWFINNIAAPLVEVLGVVLDVFTALTKVVVMLATLLAPAWTIISNVIEGLWNAAVMILQPFLDLIDALFVTFGMFADNVSYFGDAIATVAQIVGVAITVYFAPWLALLSAVSWALTKLIDLFNDFYSGASDAASGFSLLNMVSSALATTWEYLASVGAFFSRMWSAVSEGIGEATSYLTKFWNESSVVATVFGQLSDAWTNLSNALSDAFSSLAEAFRPLLELFGVFNEEASAGSGLMNVLELVAYGLARVFGEFLQTAILSVTTVLTGLINIVTFGVQVISGFVNAVMMPWTWAMDKVVSLVGPLVTSLDNLFNAIMGEGSLASAAMDVFVNSVQLALLPLSLLSDALAYACSWFGASGEGIIEESEWAAEALNNLEGPAYTAGGALESLASSLETITSSIAFLSGEGMDNIGKNLAKIGNVDVSMADGLHQSLAELKSSIPAINSVYSAVAAAITRGVTAVNAAADKAFGILNPLSLMIGGFGIGIQELFSSPVIEAPVNAETISTIHVATKDEVGETMRETVQEKRENENVELMRKLIDSVNEIKLSPTVIASILALLEKHLPDISSDAHGGLQTELNKWRT